MYWLAYKSVGERVTWMRVIESDERPMDVEVINNGFEDPDKALSLLPHYFRLTESGFIDIPAEHAARHVTWADRVRLAYAVEPRLIWAVLATYGLIGLVGLLLVVHMVAAP